MGKIHDIATKSGAEVQRQANSSAGGTVMAIFNSILDRDGYRRRIEELLGKRTPQFLSALVSVVNGSEQLKQVVFTAPATIIQAAMKAASYDLPIDPGLGFAYIVPFKNNKTDRLEASFIIGYRGLIQLALRTGFYRRLNVVELREGELKKYDLLRDDIEINFEEDYDLREQLPITAYVAYLRLGCGMEKIVYWSVPKIQAHEERNRKGKYMNPIWKNDFDSMARKTVLRDLLGKWGLLSVDYHYAPDSPAYVAMSALLEDGEENYIDGEMQEQEQQKETEETTNADV